MPATPGQARKKPMHIPVRIGLLDENGDDIALKLDDGSEIKDGVLHLTKRRHKFRFTGVATRPVPSLLRGFSAPVNLTIERADDELAFLMANDSDRFNRWQAGVDYATRIMLALTADHRSEAALARADHYADALAAALGDDALPAAYRAELVKLPTESDVAQAMAKAVDPGQIHTARRTFQKRVGQVLGLLLEEVYAAEHDAAAPFSPDAASAGRRALRNGVLTLLVARGRGADKARLEEHFKTAGNMTDANDDETFQTSRAFTESLGKTTAVSEDFPAFIVNRILLPMINEAVYTLYEGVGTVDAIDKALKLGANHPMGPLELADFIGLDTCLSVMQVLYEGLADTKYRPCPLLVKYVEAGWLGRKAQRGFYDYRGDTPVPTR